MSVQFCLASGTVLWSLQALSCTDLYSLYRSVKHLVQVLKDSWYRSVKIDRLCTGMFYAMIRSVTGTDTGFWACCTCYGIQMMSYT